MQNLIIFIYFVISICSNFYTYFVTKEDLDYVKEVHAHMASIIFFHLTIVSYMIYSKPEFVNNIQISILNTMLSIMFSTLFYFTDKSKTKLLYIYTVLYLIFASILMSEIIIYFKNDTFIYAFVLMIGMFLTDLFFYRKDRRKQLIIGYITISTFGLLMSFYDINYLYSVLGSIVYGLIILGYMYYDHDSLSNSKDRDHLNDALKYFLDFEGSVIRLVDKYLEK